MGAAAADDDPVSTDPAPQGNEDPVSTDGETLATDASRVHSFVEWGRERAGHQQARLADAFERYRDRAAVDVGLRLYRRDRESAGTVVGSAIAFRMFLFFVPFLLLIVGLLGFARQVVDAEDVTSSTGVSGGVAAQIRVALQQPDTTRWLALLFGLVGIATTGRTLSKVMFAASCLAWRLPMVTKASIRVIGAIVGLIASVGLVASLVTRVRAELGFGVASVSFLAAFGIYTVAWLLLSMLLPRATHDPGALLPGSVLVAATLAGMQAVSQLYLPDKLGRASQLYGAIGTTIVTLGWFFILGRAIVFGMALNAVLHERFGTISQFVFSLPIMRILPRKSPRLRRFFGLEEEEKEEEGTVAKAG